MAKRTPITPGYLDRKGAARYISRSTSFIDKARKAGLVPYFRLSSRGILFRVSDLDEWLDQSRIDPTRQGRFASEGGQG